MKREMHRLTVVQSARLVNLLENEFASSKKTDGEFAAYASEKLGVEIKTSHVQNRREELGIPALQKNVVLVSGERVEALERRLASAEAEIEKLKHDEFRAFKDLEERIKCLEQVARLKGTFEVPR